MKLLKKGMPVLLALGLIVSSATNAMACTGVYVGNAVSENGSTYMGRSEDIGDTYGKIFGVAPSKTIEPGEVYEDTYGFVMNYDEIDFDYPSTTYSYTYVKDSPLYGETMADAEGNPIGEAYAEAGQNEKGVSMSATVSTNYNKDAKAADPLVGSGICEVSMTSLVLGGASTAKEGVELMAAIIDKYGAGECNSIMLSDDKETWYMEIVSGHQYAAIKMPADKVSVQPNIMLLGAIDVTDTENVIASENLVKVAQDNGFLETDENGNIDVAKTYAGEKSGAGQYSRYWQGLYYVNKAEAEAIQDTIFDTNNGVNPLPLLISPDKTFSTLDVLHLLAYRGEGTAMDSNTTGYYAIGNNRQAECHVFETRSGMPTELATIQWQAMADAEFSIFLPYYSALVDDVLDSYDCTAVKGWGESVTDEAFAEKTKDSINWNFQVINNLCYSNREKCAENVKAYFEDWQEALIEAQKDIDEEMLKIYEYDKELAKEKATALGEDLAQQTLEMTNIVRAELVEYLGSDGTTGSFVPSVMTENVMPVYSFDNIGGTGLPAVDDSETGDGNVDTNPGDNNENPGNTDEKPVTDDANGTANGSDNAGQTENPGTVDEAEAPETGDNANTMLFVTIALASAVGAVAFKKKTEK